MNRLPEIRAFINDDAKHYPDLKVHYVGGDPRVRFITSANREPLDVNLNEIHQEDVRGVARDQTVNISDLKRIDVAKLLKSKGVTYTGPARDDL